VKITPAPGDTIAVWFSNGAASAVALQETLRQYGEFCQVRAINNPVAEEDEDNDRFRQDVERWLNVKIEVAINRQFPLCSAEEVWDRQQYMAGIDGAPCTKYLKKFARQAWQNEHKPDWHVLGFTADEKRRHDRFVLFEVPNTLPVLIDAGLTKDACYRRLIESGLQLPRTYSEASPFGTGYPNANCIGCVKATSATYWNHVRYTRPAVFARRAEQSRRLGVRLVRYAGKRMFLDELPPDARGRSMKTMNVECGIFCEERA
jgi:hypothetical protein